MKQLDEEWKLRRESTKGWGEWWGFFETEKKRKEWKHLPCKCEGDLVYIWCALSYGGVLCSGKFHLKLKEQGFNVEGSFMHALWSNNMPIEETYWCYYYMHTCCRNSSDPHPKPKCLRWWLCMQIASSLSRHLIQVWDHIPGKQGLHQFRFSNFKILYLLIQASYEKTLNYKNLDLHEMNNFALDLVLKLCFKPHVR